MEPIILTYLALMFVALYMSSFFIIMTVKNFHKLYISPKPNKNYPVSIVIPCYNEGDTIQGNLIIQT